MMGGSAYSKQTGHSNSDARSRLCAGIELIADRLDAEDACGDSTAKCTVSHDTYT